MGDYLIKRGMAKKRVVVETMGEKDAGANPIAWPRDRRVDIRIREN